MWLLIMQLSPAPCHARPLLGSQTQSLFLLVWEIVFRIHLSTGKVTVMFCGFLSSLSQQTGAPTESDHGDF
jgi:hypothetical protein